MATRGAGGEPQKKAPEKTREERMAGLGVESRKIAGWLTLGIILAAVTHGVALAFIIPIAVGGAYYVSTRPPSPTPGIAETIARAIFSDVRIIADGVRAAREPKKPSEGEGMEMRSVESERGSRRGSQSDVEGMSVDSSPSSSQSALGEEENKGFVDQLKAKLPDKPPSLPSFEGVRNLKRRIFTPTFKSQSTSDNFWGDDPDHHSDLHSGKETVIQRIRNRFRK